MNSYDAYHNARVREHYERDIKVRPTFLDLVACNVGLIDIDDLGGQEKYDPDKTYNQIEDIYSAIVSLLRTIDVLEGRQAWGKMTARPELNITKPRRNCDVGTEEEQSQRFDAFCDAHKYVGDDGTNWCSTTCPCYNVVDCGIKWAQLPYDKQPINGNNEEQPK